MLVLAIGNTWLGDIIMSLPALYSIKIHCNATLFIATKPNSIDIYRQFTWISRVISNIQPSEDDLNQTYDHILIFPRSLTSIFTAIKFRSKSRIGYSSPLRSPFLTTKLQRNTSATRIHRVHYFHKLAEALGAPPIPTMPSPDLPRGAGGDGWEYLKNAIVLCPGANYGDAKMWPAEYFKRLATAFQDRLGRNVAIIGTKEEQQLCDMISSGTAIINLCGKTTISDLITIFNKASALVTNDTGSMHLASLTSIPIVAIFGSTSTVVTPPYRRQDVKIIYRGLPCSPCFARKCPLGHHMCLTTIEPEEVYVATKQLLENESKATAR